MSGVYLEEHPPVRSQFASRGTVRPTGLTVVHTAESILDTIGPDTGAENVAAFIQRRTTPGSYHDLVDSDTALQLVRYENQAYQDATGSNPYALSISFALRTTDWQALTTDKRRAFLRQGAVAFARQQEWLRWKGFPVTPLRWVSREQSSQGVAGFIRHSQRDPERRTDPGANFPADEFFFECARLTTGGFLMALTDEQQQQIYDVLVDCYELTGKSLGTVLAELYHLFRVPAAEGQPWGLLSNDLASLHAQTFNDSTDYGPGMVVQLRALRSQLDNVQAMLRQHTGTT